MLLIGGSVILLSVGGIVGLVYGLDWLSNHMSASRMKNVVDQALLQDFARDAIANQEMTKNRDHLKERAAAREAAGAPENKV